MKIIMNTDKEFVKNFIKKLKDNQGYCPCQLEKTPDTKCQCKSFRDQQEAGPCICGLYEKVMEDKN